MRKLAFLILLLGIGTILVGCGRGLDTKEVKVHFHEFHSDQNASDDNVKNTTFKSGSHENVKSRIFTKGSTDPLSREKDVARRLEMAVNSGRYDIVAVETAYNKSGLLCRATVFYRGDEQVRRSSENRLRLALIPGGANQLMPGERQDRVTELRIYSLRKYGDQLVTIQDIYDKHDQLTSVEFYYLTDKT
ncbi:hypothetical protein ACFL1U_03345 [Patescibacteria group bacterium]